MLGFGGGGRPIVFMRWTQALKVDAVYVLRDVECVRVEMPFDERLDRVWDGEIK
jgi:hypothetical protein